MRLATVVERALETAGPGIEEKGHAVSVTVDPGLAVDGDGARLEQMLENLLGNASKYTPPGGHIAIVAERHGDEAVVTITDDGVGLAPGMLPYVFDTFTQAERGLDRREGGLVIGPITER